jgi:hypothetical protein
VLELGRSAYACLAAQADVLVGPGDLGANAGDGGAVTVVGSDATASRSDTLDTTQAMIAAGADLLVIVSGDGTYNDALAGMKAVGVTVPIFGVAAGRFNTLFPKRKHDPFVSMRGDFRPFSLADLVVEEVPGLVVRVGGEVVGYGFFWMVVSNALAYSDEAGQFMTIDAARMLDGDVVPLTGAWPVATDTTRITVHSESLGEIELGRGRDIVMPTVAHTVPEMNQIMAGGFGAYAEFMGFHGVAYYFADATIPFLPTPEFFPVDQRAAAFFAGDEVRLTGLADGAVVQIDSTPIRVLDQGDAVTVEVERALGLKARSRGDGE